MSAWSVRILALDRRMVAGDLQASGSAQTRVRYGRRISASFHTYVATGLPPALIVSEFSCLANCSAGSARTTLGSQQQGHGGNARCGKDDMHHAFAPCLPRASLSNLIHGPDVVAVVVIGASADQVAVDDARLVDEHAAADLEVELALGHGRHAAALDAAGAGGDLHAVAHAGNGLAGLEEVPRDPQQVFVFANVFRRPASAEEDAQVVARIDVGETHVGLDRVAFPLLGDRPARLHLVQHHLVAPLLRRRHDRQIAVFLQADSTGYIVSTRLARIADDDQHLFMAVQAVGAGSGAGVGHASNARAGLTRVPNVAERRGRFQQAEERNADTPRGVCNSDASG